MSSQGPDGSAPTTEQVELWLSHVDSELLELQRKLEPLLTEQGRLNERRQLLKELLASFGDVPSENETRLIPSSSAETTRDRVHRQAVEIFQQAGRALHSNDLHAEFLRRGYDVPGAGRPNNITVHITGWPDIVSPERGVYGLVQHVGQPKTQTSARRRRKRSPR